MCLFSNHRGGTTAQHTGSFSKAAPPDHSQHSQEDALCLGGHKAGQQKDVVGSGPDGLLRVLQIQRSDSPTGGGVQPCSTPVVPGPCLHSGVNIVAEDEDWSSLSRSEGHTGKDRGATCVL